MLRLLLSCIFVLLLLSNCRNLSYGAFPTKQRFADTTQEAGQARIALDEITILKFTGNVDDAYRLPSDKESERQKNQWAGIVSSCCAVVAVFFLISLISIPLLFTFALAAIVFGGIGISPKRHKLIGLAVLGIILGGLALLLSPSR